MLGNKRRRYVPALRNPTFNTALRPEKNTNITSLLKHVDELCVFLNDQNINVPATNETRLNESLFDQEVKVQGYDIIRHDRSANGRFGGGVCFYIPSNKSYSVRTDLESELLEIISIEIRKHNSKLFVITSCYRPPNSLHELFTHINTLLGKLDSENVEHFTHGGSKL